jgi:hypothetical protein
MAAQVAKMQNEFKEFEQAHQSTDRVDLQELARFVESRRSLNRECFDSTCRLILASAEIMTPDQRQRYINIVADSGPLVGSLLN